MTLKFQFSGSDLLDSIYTERNIFSNKHPSMRGSSSPSSFVRSILEDVNQYTGSKDKIFAVTLCGRAIALTVATDDTIDLDDPQPGKLILKKLDLLKTEAQKIIDEYYADQFVAVYSLIPTRLSEQNKIFIREGGKELFGQLARTNKDLSYNTVNHILSYAVVTPIILICPINNMSDILAPDEFNDADAMTTDQLAFLRKVILNSSHTLAGGLSKVLIEALNAYIYNGENILLKTPITHVNSSLNHGLVIKSSVVQEYLRTANCREGLHTWLAKKVSDIDMPLNFNAFYNNGISKLSLNDLKLIGDTHSVQFIVSIESLSIQKHDILPQLRELDTPRRLQNKNGLCHECIYKVCCLLSNTDELTPVNAGICRLLAVEKTLKNTEQILNKKLQQPKNIVLAYETSDSLVLTRRFFATIVNYCKSKGGLSPKEWLVQAQKHNLLDLITKEDMGYHHANEVDEICRFRNINDVNVTLKQKYQNSFPVVAYEIRGDIALDEYYNNIVPVVNRIKRTALSPVRQSNNSLRAEVHNIVLLKTVNTSFNREEILNARLEWAINSVYAVLSKNKSQEEANELLEKITEITNYLLSHQSPFLNQNAIILTDNSKISKRSILEEYVYCEQIVKELTKSRKYIKYNTKLLESNILVYSFIFKKLVALAFFLQQTKQTTKQQTKKQQSDTKVDTLISTVRALLTQSWYAKIVDDIYEELTRNLNSKNYENDIDFSDKIPEGLRLILSSTWKDRFGIQSLDLRQTFLIKTEIDFWTKIRGEQAKNQKTAAQIIAQKYSNIAYQRLKKLNIGINWEQILCCYQDSNGAQLIDNLQYYLVSESFKKSKICPYEFTTNVLVKEGYSSLKDYRRLIIGAALLMSLPCNTNQSLYQLLSKRHYQNGNKVSLNCESPLKEYTLKEDLLEETLVSEIFSPLHSTTGSLVTIDIVKKEFSCPIRVHYNWDSIATIETEMNSIISHYQDNELHQDSALKGIQVDLNNYISDQAMLKDVISRMEKISVKLSLQKILQPQYWAKLPSNSRIYENELQGLKYYDGIGYFNGQLTKLTNFMIDKIGANSFSVAQALKPEYKIRTTEDLYASRVNENFEEPFLLSGFGTGNILDGKHINDFSYEVADLLMITSPNGCKIAMNLKDVSHEDTNIDTIIEEKNIDEWKIFASNKFFLDYASLMDQRIALNRSGLKKIDIRKGICSKGPAVMGLRPKVSISKIWEAVDSNDTNLDWRSFVKINLLKAIIQHKQVILDLIKENELIIYPDMDLDITFIDTNLKGQRPIRINKRIQFRQITIDQPTAILDTMIKKLVAERFARRYAFGNGFVHKLDMSIEDFYSKSLKEPALAEQYTFISSILDTVGLSLKELNNTERHAHIWTNQIGILKDVIVENINDDIQTIEYRLHADTNIYQYLVPSYSSDENPSVLITEADNRMALQQRDIGAEFVSTKLIIRKNNDKYEIVLHDGSVTTVYSLEQLIKIVQASLMEQFYFIYRQLYSLKSLYVKGLFTRNGWYGDTLLKLAQNPAYMLVTKTLIPGILRRKGDIVVGKDSVNYFINDIFLNYIGKEGSPSIKTGILAEDKELYVYAKKENVLYSHYGYIVEKEEMPGHKAERRAQLVSHIAFINNAIENRSCYLPIIDSVLTSKAITMGIDQHSSRLNKKISKLKDLYCSKLVEIAICKDDLQKFIAANKSVVRIGEQYKNSKNEMLILNHIILPELTYIVIRIIMKTRQSDSLNYDDFWENDLISFVHNLSSYDLIRLGQGNLGINEELDFTNGELVLRGAIRKLKEIVEILRFSQEPGFIDLPGEFVRNKQEIISLISFLIYGKSRKGILFEKENATIGLHNLFYGNVTNERSELMRWIFDQPDYNEEIKENALARLNLVVQFIMWRLYQILKYGLHLKLQKEKENLLQVRAQLKTAMLERNKNSASQHTQMILAELDKKYLT